MKKLFLLSFRFKTLQFGSFDEILVSYNYYLLSFPIPFKDFEIDSYIVYLVQIQKMKNIFEDFPFFSYDRKWDTLMDKQYSTIILRRDSFPRPLTKNRPPNKNNKLPSYVNLFT